MTEKWEEAHHIARTIPLLYTRKAKREAISRLLVALRRALSHG